MLYMATGKPAHVGRKFLFDVSVVNSPIVVELLVITVLFCVVLPAELISPTRCNNCVFILRNGFTLHVSGHSLTHHQGYICCIWLQVSRLT